MHFRAALLSAASATAARAAYHEIVVGDFTAPSNSTQALVFLPDVLEASVGDTIRFIFAAEGSKHRVVKGLYGPPCVADPGGFDSGYRAVTADVASRSHFDIVLRRDGPFYFFCAQAGARDERAHCLQGMVGMVNGSPTDLAAYRDAARSLKSLPPIASTLTGQGFPTPTAEPRRGDGGMDDRTKMLLVIFFGGLTLFFLFSWGICRRQRRGLRVLNARYGEVATPVSREPDPVTTTNRVQAGPEELELPRYEERRGDTLLAAGAPVAEPPPVVAADPPPPAYGR